MGYLDLIGTQSSGSGADSGTKIGLPNFNSNVPLSVQPTALPVISNRASKKRLTHKIVYLQLVQLSFSITRVRSTAVISSVLRTYYRILGSHNKNWVIIRRAKLLDFYE